MGTHSFIPLHLSIYRHTWDEGKDVMGAMGLDASLHFSSYLPAPNTAMASLGVLELGSGRLVRWVRTGEGARERLILSLVL